MGHQRTYSWEFKLQMIQLLEKGERHPSQISRDHRVTLSLLNVWWQLYRKRGEAAFVPTKLYTVPQKWIDRILHRNRLPIWSGCVGSRLWNSIY
jgi:transposase-like protein